MRMYFCKFPKEKEPSKIAQWKTIDATFEISALTSARYVILTRVLKLTSFTTSLLDSWIGRKKLKSLRRPCGYFEKQGRYKRPPKILGVVPSCCRCRFLIILLSIPTTNRVRISLYLAASRTFRQYGHLFWLSLLYGSLRQQACPHFVIFQVRTL